VAAEHGDGFELENFEPATGKAVMRREDRTAIASHTGNDSIEVPLPSGTTERDGKKRALSFADAYPGFTMTVFEPHRRRAILSKLSEDIVLARDAIAQALRCEPWDIQVTERTQGGFDFTVPSGYRPSVHDKALKEATETIIGEPGWYFTTDTRSRTGSIIPAKLSTFDASYPTPLPEAWGGGDYDPDRVFTVPYLAEILHGYIGRHTDGPLKVTVMTPDGQYHATQGRLPHADNSDAPESDAELHAWADARFEDWLRSMNFTYQGLCGGVDSVEDYRQCVPDDPHGYITSMEAPAHGELIVHVQNGAWQGGRYEPAAEFMAGNMMVKIGSYSSDLDLLTV